MKTAPLLRVLLAACVSAVLVAGAATPPLTPPLVGWQVWPSTGERIVPASLAPATVTNASVDIVSARGVTGSASFALRSAAAFKSLAVVPGSLAAADGSVLPADRLDLRVVKCWFQDANGWFADSRAPGGPVLVPELLLHDDTLVLVDLAARENLVRISPAGATPAYRRIQAASDGGTTPAQAGFVAADDAKTLQPLPLAAEETRQFYLTLDVPAAASPGRYHGTLAVVGDGKALGHVELNLRVLDHQLPVACSRFSGRGSLDGTKVFSGSFPAVVTTAPDRFMTVGNLPPDRVTPASVAFLAAAGIDYPVLPPSRLADVKTLCGGQMPDALWVAEPGALTSSGQHLPDPEHAATLAKAALATGVTDVRVFLEPPLSGAEREAGLKTLEAVDDAGARAWVFADDATYRAAAPLIRAPMRRGLPPEFSERREAPPAGDPYGNTEYSDTRQAERWHAIGVPYYLCVNLPTGVEDPSLWRRHLGVECFYLGYDGFILPDLTEPADPWNDWAAADHRSRTLLYPTQTGFVPTLAWAGVREGVTDARYLSSLRRLADAVRYAGVDNPLLDIEGRKASMWLEWLDPRVAGLDTARLDAIAWICRLDAFLAKVSKPAARQETQP